jgi:ABC-type transport system involved in multi-copper enzyme maturation permease subunit
MAIASLSKLNLSESNPIVMRDLRVSLRGPRAFIGHGACLVALIAFTLAGYNLAVPGAGATELDPAEIQGRLGQFYRFVVGALIVLVTFMAPALTAASIVSEKQKLTFDLLVTTPMSPAQMLAGKLLSSIAYVLLLLSLSLPALSLCVILGGATLPDVLQTYALLVIEGVLLAAVGLNSSCSAKNVLSATLKTYGIVALVFVLVVVALRPYLPVNRLVTLSVGAIDVPLWIPAALLAMVVVWVLLSAAAEKMGLSERQTVSSLRLKILVLSFIGAFACAWVAFHPSLPVLGLAPVSGIVPVTGIGLSGRWVGEAAIFRLVALVFALGLPFLPSLFVPALEADSPGGQSVSGRYNWRCMFKGEHSGSLPYFHLWLYVCLVGASTALLVTSLVSGSMAQSNSISIGTMPHFGTPMAGTGYPAYQFQYPAQSVPFTQGQSQTYPYQYSPPGPQVRGILRVRRSWFVGATRHPLQGQLTGPRSIPVAVATVGLIAIAALGLLLWALGAHVARRERGRQFSGQLKTAALVVAALFSVFVIGISANKADLQADELCLIGSFVYFSVFGLFMWSLSRLAFWITGNSRTARPMAFFSWIFLAALPWAVMAVAEQGYGLQYAFNGPLRSIWILSPLNTQEGFGDALETVVIVTIISMVVFPCWRVFCPRKPYVPETGGAK